MNGKTGDKKSVFHRRDSLRETLFLLSYPGLCSNVLPEEVRVEKDGDMLRAHARMAGAAMDVHSPIRPVPRKAWKGYAALNGTLLNETYGLPSPIEENA